MTISWTVTFIAMKHARSYAERTDLLLLLACGRFNALHAQELVVLLSLFTLSSGKSCVICHLSL